MDNIDYIIKRDGSKVPFDAHRIQKAIEKALVSTQQSVSDSLSITQNVCSRLQKLSILTVEQCQDIVEDELMKSNYRTTAKAYILYREERAKRRQCFISEDWKLQTKEAASYFDSAYQYIVYLRTYAKWLADKNRRETWPETVTRFMNFMREIVQDKLDEHEYKELEFAILRMMVMPSMRLLQFAGEAVRRNNICAYNCSFIAPTSLSDLHDTMMVLMCGTGAGFSVERKYIDQLPKIVAQYDPADIPCHTVGDSREEWCEAFLLGLETWYQGKDIQFDYSLVRQAGKRLKTTGGRASGPTPLKDLLNFARELILDNQDGKLSTINVHDLMCKIGHIVVVGGVRRSSEISLSDLDDEAMRNAKMGPFWNTHPDRCMANNSAVYNKTPTDLELLNEWSALANSGTGERGIFNRSRIVQQLPERRVKLLGDLVKDMGTNPCSEIFLLPCGFCNLTSPVLRADDTRESIIRKVRLATILGTYQSMLTDFKNISPRWKELAEKERLLGVSLNGQRDCKYLQDHVEILDELKAVAIETNKEYAERFGINQSSAITCVKPEGTTSQMLDTSSGLHVRFSPYYIRRLRISATDSLAKLLIDQGVPHFPENGQTVDNVTTWVFEFPQKSPEGAVCAKDVTAMNQLNYWKEVKVRYTEHNPSCTIYVKNDEWITIVSWVKENWDIIGGLSFLPFDEHIYQLAPYEELTKEQYEIRMREIPEIDFAKLVLFEKEDCTERKMQWACSGGACELK